jgi:hypothetical protein
MTEYRGGKLKLLATHFLMSSKKSLTAFMTVFYQARSRKGHIL